MAQKTRSASRQQDTLPPETEDRKGKGANGKGGGKGAKEEPVAEPKKPAPKTKEPEFVDPVVPKEVPKPKTPDPASQAVKTKTLIRDRVKKLVRVKASDLKVNPKNWRTHSKEQMDALSSILDQVGFAGAELARELPDGTLELIDGHARMKAAGDSIIPVLILDVNEQEADTILATFDTIGSMAGADAVKLNQLMANVRLGNQALNDIIGEMSWIPDIDKDSEDATQILDEQKQRIEAFQEVKRQSVARLADRCQESFYVCLVFQSWEQRQEFLANMPEVPVLYNTFVDGQTLSQRLGIEITLNTQPPIAPSVIEKKLKAMAMEPMPDQ